MNHSHDNTTLLQVDLSADTGPLKYGASGFLYGLGDEGIPTPAMLIPLKPQVAAQKPPDGAQHPNGDAFKVSELFKMAGGREIQIYMQDMYAKWPYEFSGLPDYITKVETITRAVVAHPKRHMFSYVPLNEPDQIWYNTTDKKQALFDDWKTLYTTILAIDPDARIVGPNFANYHSDCYRDFFTFCRDNNCLPHVTSWHELQDDFFNGWYARYDDYRAIERDLGIPPREIAINEYARIKGDLAIPGQLVQWIARFENSKVDACLAYWTAAGSLNDLVTQNSQATGAWWLYKWYGGLTGHTIRVTPPNANAEGLDGLAALDTTKQQARIILGGHGGFATVLISGFDAATCFDRAVHVTMWAVDSSDTNPSPGPRFVMEGDYHIDGERITVPVNDMSVTTAYHMIITPVNATRSSASLPNRYNAEYADISGNLSIMPGMACINGYDETTGITFVVTAPENGFYTAALRYSVSSDRQDSMLRHLRLTVNGTFLKNVTCPATANQNSWQEVTITIFLPAGINRIAFNAVPGETGDALNIDYLELSPGSGPISVYEAEAEENTLNGETKVRQHTAASGGSVVANIGNGTENSLQFNHVIVPAHGTYKMVVYYANAEMVGEHEYNTNVVDRGADISVNGGSPQRVYFRNTLSWDTFRTTVVDVELRAGENTIRFSNATPNGVNATAYGPYIDRIDIAPCESKTERATHL